MTKYFDMQTNQQSLKNSWFDSWRIHFTESTVWPSLTQCRISIVMKFKTKKRHPVTFNCSWNWKTTTSINQRHKTKILWNSRKSYQEIFITVFKNLPLIYNCGVKRYTNIFMLSRCLCYLIQQTRLLFSRSWK